MVNPMRHSSLSISHGHFIIRLLKFLHFAVSLASFYAAWLLFRYGTFSVVRDRGFRYNYLILAGYALLSYFFLRTFNAYLLGYSRIRTLAFSQILSHTFSLAILYVFVSAGWAKIKNPVILFALLVLQALFDAAWSYFANWLFFRYHPTKKTVLVYRNNVDLLRFGSVSGKPVERLYRITEKIQYDGNHFEDIRDRITGYEAIFVAGVSSRCRNGIVKYCQENSIPGFFLPHVGDVIMQGAMHIQSFSTPVLYVSRKSPNPEYLALKRAFDFTASLLGIVVLSPLMGITALAIKLYDGGPALYRQTRLTKDGRTFRICKFRSMREDAEKDGVARLSSGEKDSRITPVGRVIRKCRLDELPQLFNILKGDMSVVGPRPERPEIAEQYYEKLPDFKLRLQVKAGLTGYAQVYGKYNSSPYEKLEFDLLYINHMGIITDLRLIFATFGILFSPESTEGIAENQLTAIPEAEHQ